MEVARNLVGGSWDTTSGGTRVDSVDPATGEPVGQAVAGTAAIANDAIEAAREAFETSYWSQDMRLRFRVLMAFARNLRARHDEITELLVRESGKIRAQAHHEIAAGINEAEYFCRAGTVDSGPNIWRVLRMRFSFFMREPRRRCRDHRPLERAGHASRTFPGARNGGRMHVRDQAGATNAPGQCGGGGLP